MPITIAFPEREGGSADEITSAVEAAQASATAAAASAAAAADSADEAVADVQAEGATQIAAVVAQGTTSIAAVSAQGTTSIAAVAAQQATSVSAVQAQQVSSVAAVAASSADPIADVEAAGDTAVAAVQAQEATSVAAVEAASNELIDNRYDYQTWGEYAGTWADSGGGGFINTQLVAFEQPADSARTITEVAFRAEVVADVTLKTYSKSGDTFTVTGSETITVSSTGNQTHVTSLAVASGEYLGFVSSSAAMIPTNTGNTGQRWYQGTGTTSFVDAALSSTSLRLYIRVRARKTVSTVWPTIRPTNLNLPFENALVIGGGQSNGEGGDGGAITTAQEYNTLCLPCFQGTQTNTLRYQEGIATNMDASSAARDENPLFGFAKHFNDALASDHYASFEDMGGRLILGSNAIGGTTIANMSQGTDAFQFGLDLAQFVTDTLPGTSGVPYITFTQGEADGSTGTTEADYITALKTLADDYNTDIKAITGQTQDIHLISWQVSSESNRYIGIAQLKASHEHPLIHIACPSYMLTYWDSVHITSAMSRVLGAYYARAALSIAETGSWEPHKLEVVSVNGARILLRSNRRKLAKDTATVPAQTNDGFQLFNASAVSQTISSVTILNDNEIEVVAAANVDAGYVLKYGRTASGMTPFAGTAGNIRDTSGDHDTIDSWDLHDWLIFQDWTLSASIPAGAGTVTSVAVSGGSTGLTTSGGPVTGAGTITLAGTLGKGNGGTGQTTYTDGQLLIGNSTGNTLTKATLTQGSGITITNGAGSITIAATGGGSGTVTDVAALTLGTTGTDLSSSVADGTTTPVITLNVPTASASNRGALSAADWSTFNGKQASISFGAGVLTFIGTPTFANLVTAVTGDTVVGRASTDTLTNKRITSRVSTVNAPSSPQAIDSDAYDQVSYTAVGGALTLSAPTGTPTAGQRLIIRLKDDGTGRALTWTTGANGFRAIGITLPTTTTANKTTYVGCIWNATDSRWDAIATVTEA